MSARCDELGTAGLLLRTAAVIGPELDADLLAAVLGRPVVALLDDAEQAVAKQFLVEDDGIFRFRHELLREALAASATAGRAALLHRQVGRMLDRRPGADPLTVAGHARLGGDLVLAARALRDASAQAAERFDHAAAEALLDDALRLSPGPEGWLARARVRTLRRRYIEALEDVERALGVGAAGAAALEVGAWASYFGRQFAQAIQFAEDGALAAEDATTRARCLAVGGRTRHANGDLAQAELLLGEAFSLAEGADRVTAAGWLGVLRAHQSRVDEALALLRPAARGQLGVEHTSATLHSLLFTGHAHALAGRPAQALAAFTRYTAEVERRQVPRFAGRAVNFAGWVLRNLGAWTEALDHHHEALEVGQRQGTADVTIAALEDLAEQCLDTGDADGAQARLAQAGALLHGNLVFGWRLELKHQFISARLALARGDAERALADADDLAARAAALGVPRYTSVARLLVHRANRALGLPVDPGAVAADLDLLVVHLHVHSSYSLLEGALTIARLAELAKKDRQPALALTDTDNMFGALEFSEKMAGYGIQPIVGCALGVDFGDQENRGPAGGRDLAAHRAARRARKRLPQPDAAVVARLSGNRAARAPALETCLARRRDRRPDRAHRRAQWPARRRHRRRPERVGAGALRRTATPVRRPALYRIAAPRHGERAHGRAGLDRARLWPRHCARRHQRAVLRHARGL